jgi:hypothetical protein
MEWIAIIGTREPDIQQARSAWLLARTLTKMGYGVTTGAADGIDTRAMEGSYPDHLHVFLPWNTYNCNKVPEGAEITVYNPKVHLDWTASVKKYHPAFNRLRHGPIALHARNFGIIEPSIAVAAFPDEKGGGGTAQGIRIAKDLGKPVFQNNRGLIGVLPQDLVKDILQELQRFSSENHHSSALP